MLRDDERHASLAQTLGVLCHHVVAHNLYVAHVVAQEEFAHDVRLRVECDAMVYAWMLLKEFFQHGIVFVACAFERQTQLRNLYLWEMVVHIMAETYFAVHLLLARHLSVLHLFQEHYLLLVACDEHEHLGCEIAAAERVLTEERERLEVGHV